MFTMEYLIQKLPQNQEILYILMYHPHDDTLLHKSVYFKMKYCCQILMNDGFSISDLLIMVMS